MHLVLAFLISLIASTAVAQPYAAGGGFARPALDDARASAASVSVAVAQSGTITTVWGGSDGVWRQDRTAADGVTHSLVAATNDVRSVSARYVTDGLVVSWVSRDRSTGVYHYYALVNGEQRHLFTDALVVDLALFDYLGSPYAAGLFRRDGEGQIRVIALDDDTQTSNGGQIIYSTSLTLRGLDVLPTQDGQVWLGWLEGRNERGEFGLISEWDAFVARLPALNQPLLGPVGLGEANVEDERLRVALVKPDLPRFLGQQDAPPSEDSGSEVWALWADADHVLRLSQLEAGPTELSAVTADRAVGHGRPIGAVWPYFYWVSGSSIVRLSVLETEPQNVAWSPVTIEGTGFSSSFAPTDAVSAYAVSPTAIAWFGRAQGGAIQVYSTNDRVAMQPNLADRLAALMGWNPWHLWDELLGQVLTALLIGVLAAIALVPPLVVLGPVLGRMVRTPSSALALGVLTALLLLVLGTFIYQRGFPLPAERRLIWLSLAASGVLGALTGWLVGRSGDRESQATFTVAGATTVFISATVWSFLTYKQWAPLVGLN